MSQSTSLRNRQSVATATIVCDALVVFDARVADLSLLYKALLPGTIGYTIDESEDAILRITELLSQTGAKRLAIVAHGEPGVILLGREAIDLGVVQARSGLLQEWCVDAIDLYSCEVGADTAFVDLLGEVTGSRVAASARQVGAEALGGSWELDGRDYFQACALAEYPHTLAFTAINSTTFSSGINTTEAGSVAITVPTTNRGSTQDGNQVRLEIYSGSTLIYSQLKATPTTPPLNNSANTTFSPNLTSILGDDLTTLQGNLTFTVTQGTGGTVGTSTWNPTTDAPATLQPFTPSPNASTTNSSVVNLDTIAPSTVPTVLDLQVGSDSSGSTGTNTDNLTNDTTPTFDIQFDPAGLVAGNRVVLFNGATEIGSYTLTSGDLGGPTTTVAITSSVLTTGAKNITSRIVDVAGNQGVATSALSVTIDTVATPGTISLGAFTDTRCSSFS